MDHTPAGVIRIEFELVVIFTGSITEVVTPHIGWDGDGQWVVDVGAGTDMPGEGAYFIKSYYKCPDIIGNMDSHHHFKTHNAPFSTVLVVFSTLQRTLSS